MSGRTYDAVCKTRWLHPLRASLWPCRACRRLHWDRREAPTEADAAISSLTALCMDSGCVYVHCCKTPVGNGDC